MKLPSLRLGGALRSSLLFTSSLVFLGGTGCGSSTTPPDTTPGGAGNATGGTGSGSGGAASGGAASGGGTSTGGRTGNGPGAGGPAYGERSAANVFFSGHSLMDNPITDWTAAIATAKGDAIGWEQQILIGSPIAARTKGADFWQGYSHAAAKNKDGQQGVLNVLTELATPTRLPSGQSYDTLLITERHDPLNTVEYENTIGFLRHYFDRVAEHSETARALFYQVWPDIDKANPAPWIEYQFTELTVWECMAEKANLSLEAEGRTKSVAVVPGSAALARLVEEVIAGNVPGVGGTQTERLDAIFSDNVHLAPVGQYFIASVLYAATFGKSPVGAHASDSLDDATENALETLAWNEISEYFESGHPEGRPLSECRTSIETEVCPVFYTIRGNPAQSCDYWGSADSPFNYPDADFLYPAP